jgi:hypothetical protein
MRYTIVFMMPLLRVYVIVIQIRLTLFPVLGLIILITECFSDILSDRALKGTESFPASNAIDVSGFYLCVVLPKVPQGAGLSEEKPPVGSDQPGDYCLLS